MGGTWPDSYSKLVQLTDELGGRGRSTTDDGGSPAGCLVRLGRRRAKPVNSRVASVK